MLYEGMEAVRLLVGAGANTKDTPVQVTDYDPSRPTAKSPGSRLWRILSGLKPSSLSYGASDWIVTSADPKSHTSVLLLEHLHQGMYT